MTNDKTALDAFPTLAYENLKNHQGQCDRDGIMCQVSRQALHELLAYVDNTRPQPCGDAVERATIVEAVGKILRSCNETDWASRRFAMAEWIADSVIKTLGDKINVK